MALASGPIRGDSRHQVKLRSPWLAVRAQQKGHDAHRMMPNTSSTVSAPAPVLFKVKDGLKGPPGGLEWLSVGGMLRMYPWLSRQRPTRQDTGTDPGNQAVLRSGHTQVQFPYPPTSTSPGKCWENSGFGGESCLPQLGKSGVFPALRGCSGKALTHGLGASVSDLARCFEDRFLPWALLLVVLARRTG